MLHYRSASGSGELAMKPTALIVAFVRAMRRRCAFTLAIPFVLFALAACSSSAPVAGAAPDAKVQESLAFLVDGKTRKEEVLSRLGIPTGAFENERILTYWITFLNKTELITVGSVSRTVGYGGGKLPDLYQLILVFDMQDVLEKHKLMTPTT